MAESSSSLRKSKTNQKVLNDSDDIVAAQQLMQLSSEEDDDDNHKNNNKNTDEEIDQNPCSKITSAQVQEIFGKEEEEEEVSRLGKRRYRSLVHIYMTTKPMNTRHAKKRRY